MQRLMMFCLGIVLLFCLNNCQEDEVQKPDYEIEFLILDRQTGEPLEGAEIKVLEGGPSVSSNTEGAAGFTLSELTGKNLISITDSVAYGFSVNHPQYQREEFNASAGKFVVKLSGDSTETYHYTQPVQLDDGLSVASLTEVGFDTSVINDLMAKIAKPGYRDLHSILIYKDGKLVLEDYFFGNNDTIQFENGIIRDRRPAPIWWSRNEKHYVASVNKALTSTLVGIALDSKGLSTDALIKDYLPDYASYFEGDPKKSAVKFHHALNMTLGFQWDEWGSTDLKLLWQSDDFAEFLLSRNNKGPDTEWYYNSASPNVLLQCVQNMVGEPVRTWAQENFYGKLGITDFKWQSQPGGYPEGAARMYLRPRDMLKVGVTYLNNGKWNDEQVIPEAWVEKCWQVQERTSSGDYSHFFWLRKINTIKYLSADGDGGNFINIFPEQNMVIVITQGNYLQWPLYVNQANDMMGKYILPALVE